MWLMSKFAGVTLAACIRSGKLDCWDTITRKRQVTPNALFRAVSPGWDHICGLGIASELICWGDNLVGKSVPPTGTFQSVASGFDHVCALDFSGSGGLLGE